jgi:inhibitor of cysteine peptidase
MKKLLMLVAVGLVLALAGGCSGSSSTVLPSPVSLTSADFGHAVTVAAGESFTITLDANPTTGYSWHCTWVPTARLSLTADTYTPTPVPDGVVGSGGTQTYTLKALTAGDATVTLQYGRWWEGGDKQDPQTITVHVTG